MSHLCFRGAFFKRMDTVFFSRHQWDSDLYADIKAQIRHSQAASRSGSSEAFGIRAAEITNFETLFQLDPSERPASGRSVAHIRGRSDGRRGENYGANFI